MTITKHIILLLGQFPLQWPTDGYQYKPECDPGEIVHRDNATRFDTPEEARLKGLDHYRGMDFRVVPTSYTL
jgi:hypothetical protein